MMILNEKEIDKAYLEASLSIPRNPSEPFDVSRHHDRAIAKAQLKKDLQEIEDYIARDLEWASEEDEMMWKEKLQLWRQSLLKEAE